MGWGIDHCFTHTYRSRPKRNRENSSIYLTQRINTHVNGWPYIFTYAFQEGNK
jgi:hypothetical protein